MTYEQIVGLFGSAGEKQLQKWGWEPGDEINIAAFHELLHPKNDDPFWKTFGRSKACLEKRRERK